MSTQRHPLNASGDFYVENGMCIACEAPEHEAPALIGHCDGDDGTYHCYFKRQPITAAETTQAIRAVSVGCCGAVRYGGNNRLIIAKLVNLRRGDACDNLSLLGLLASAVKKFVFRTR